MRALPPPFNRYFPDTGNFIAFVGDDSAADFVARQWGRLRWKRPRRRPRPKAERTP